MKRHISGLGGHDAQQTLPANSEREKGRVVARMRDDFSERMAEESESVQRLTVRADWGHTKPAPTRETLQLQQLPLVPRRDHPGCISPYVQQGNPK